MKKIITILFFVGIIGVLGYAYIPGVIAENQSRNATQGVLDNLIKQDYEKAFESVYFYDRASDLEPTISYEEAKNKWVQRVKALKESGTYVVDYKNLNVKLEDTYPEGTVDLVIVENGEEKIKENVGLWFAHGEGSWRLGNFNYRHVDIEEKWENALSGNFNERMALTQ